MSSYVVFGENGVVIGFGSTVIGLVGARNNNATTNVAIRMNGGAKIIADGAILGDARSGGDVRMDSNTLIEDTLTRAVGTTLTTSASAVIGADVVADPQLPPLPAPTPLTCPTGGANFSGANNQTLALAPGTYGAISFGGQFTLNLTAPGNYFFDSIKAGNGSAINAVPGVHVFVCDAASFGSVAVSGVAAGEFSIEVQSSDPENAFRAGGGSAWVGDVFAPNGGIHVGSGGSTASVNGHLVAGQIVDIEHGVVVQAPCCAPGPQNAPPKEATLLHGAKNENNGANNSILVKVQVASVIGFPFNTVLQNAGATLPVTKAVLRLFVCNTPNDPNFCPDSAHAPDGQNFTPHDWPAAGAHDTAFEMADGFERWGSGLPPTNTPPEGNGNNFPTDNNPRGNGAGVTWNCVIDTNITNEAQDCSGADFWNGGLKAQLTPGIDSTTLITNSLADGAAVDFDVTAQFNAGIGPLDTMFISWFIRKVSGPGFIAYYSSEGSQAKLGAGNFSLAPTLVITP